MGTSGGAGNAAALPHVRPGIHSGPAPGSARTGRYRSPGESTRLRMPHPGRTPARAARHTRTDASTAALRIPVDECSH
jgi:hypothetical protein